MATEFGNRLGHLRRASIMGAILATAIAIVFMSVAYAHGNLSRSWVSSILLALFIGCILPLVAFLTCLFSIRLDQERVTHVFCGRFVLSQQPLSELESIEVGGPFAVVFRFSRGTIRFFGAHMRVVQSLCERILELRPDLADAHE
ncbi:MAG: hypothetical protein QOH01_1620 [Verrucomicrobiota bacterium]|jgi:hypothetical protein